jgi:hypothetical protein
MWSAKLQQLNPGPLANPHRVVRTALIENDDIDWLETQRR